MIILAVFFIQKWRLYGQKSSSSLFLFPNKFNNSAEFFCSLLNHSSNGVYSQIDESNDLYSLCSIISLTNNSKQGGNIKYSNVRECNILILNIDKFNKFIKNGIKLHGNKVVDNTFGADKFNEIVLFYAYFAIEDGIGFYKNPYLASIDALFTYYKQRQQFDSLIQVSAFSGFGECCDFGQLPCCQCCELDKKNVDRKYQLLKLFFFKKISGMHSMMTYSHKTL